MPAFGQTITRQTTFSPIITSSPTITNNVIGEPSLTTPIVNGPIQSPTDSNDSQPSGPSIPSTPSPPEDIGRLPNDDVPTFINPIAPSIDDAGGADTVDDDRNWGDVLTFPEFDDGSPDNSEGTPGEDDDRFDPPGEDDGSDDAPSELVLERPSFNSVSCTDRASYSDFLKDDDLEALLGSDWLRLEFNDCDGVYEFDRRRSPVYNIRYSNRVCGRKSFSKSKDCYGWAQALIADSKDAFYLAILRAGPAKACHQSTDETGLAPWEIVSNQSKCLSFTRDGLIVESRSGDVVGAYSQEQ